MTRTFCFSTLSSAALLVALGAFGCGSSSTIDPGGGGRTGSLGGGSGSLGGRAGSLGGSTGAGGAPATACMANMVCAAGFTCDTPCMVGNNPGIRPCACGANNRLVCPGGNGTCDVGNVDAGPPPPPMDAGFNMCTNNSPCTAGFTCEMACMVGNNPPGIRPCTCANNGRLNCPGGNGGCQFDAGPQPDAGFNMCMANTPCTAGFTCAIACNVGQNPGMRACTCNANGRVNCPGGNATCILNDAGVTPVDAPRDVVAPPPVDAAVDAPRG